MARGISVVGLDRITHHRQLARFLKKLGPRRIVLPDMNLEISDELLKSKFPARLRYRDVFTSEGLLVVACPPPFTVQKIRNAMNRHGVTAACFHGDLPACCAIHELRKAGVRVPEDLTVTGFDGMLLPFSQGQRLTTLAIPVEDMIHKVYDIVTGRETGVRCCLPLEFIKGQTHGSARPDAPTK